MVFKSKKDLMEPVQKDKKKPGPGEYLPQTKYKKIHLNKEPFLSTINGTFHRRNNYPGPGSYYQDDILIKFLKNIQNEKITENNDKKSLSQSKIYDIKNNNITNDKSNANIEKLGFTSKVKRFNITDSSSPGPGYYFPKINKFYKNKLIIKREKEYNSKQRLKDKLMKQFNLIPTIPSKNQKYGFDILEDGKIIQKKDPNLYQTFTGEKGDTVGPGSYEIEKKNELYKTRPHWTMSKDIRNCYITNWENLSKLESPSLISTNHSDNSNNNFNSSNFLSSITANNFYIDNNHNVLELSPYNISSYNISNYDSQSNFNNSNNNFNLNIANINTKKINTNYKPITNNLYYNEKFKKNSSKDILNKNDNPGPGFYIDRFKHSSFKYKYVPENKQFFGSKLERFRNINKSFDNEDSNSLNDNITKSKSFVGPAPFLSITQRFKIPYYTKEKYTYPSPSHYNINLKKIKSFSNFDKFNSSTKRFIEDNKSKWKNELPGPGYYNPEKTKKHINTKKIIISNNNDNDKDKDNDNNNRNKNKNIILKIPLNYKINTIEYLNNKKLNSTNLKNVIFFRCNPKINKSLSCQNIGPSPGSYYKEKKYEFKQIIPPFNRSSEKKVEFRKKSDINIGPGQYNRDSYFDWNKKTFNISYA